MNANTIDAVITWVDGNDPAHRDKLNRYLDSLGIARPESAAPTRFNQCGELAYCIRSIRRFAPWIKTIYVVTDNQRPALFDDLADGEVKLIDHRDIFKGFEHCLPTFNSVSIESVLHRIPNLANRFIYFNDDCFLVRPVRVEDFFCDDKLVLRGYWKTQTPRKWRGRLKAWFPFLSDLAFLNDEPDIHRKIQEASARLSGSQRRFFHQPHAPLPVLKSSLDEYFQTHPHLLAHNVRFPLRNPEQFWVISLGHHLALKNGQAIVDSRLDSITINAGFHSLAKMRERLDSARRRQNIAFVCMQSLDAASDGTQRELFNWLDSTYGEGNGRTETAETGTAAFRQTD